MTGVIQLVLVVDQFLLVVFPALLRSAARVIHFQKWMKVRNFGEAGFLDQKFDAMFIIYNEPSLVFDGLGVIIVQLQAELRLWILLMREKLQSTSTVPGRSGLSAASRLLRL